MQHSSCQGDDGEPAASRTAASGPAYLSSQLIPSSNVRSDDDDADLSDSPESPLSYQPTVTKVATAQLAERSAQPSCIQKGLIGVSSSPAADNRKIKKGGRNKTAKAKTACSAGGRGLGFSAGELDCLLDLLEEHLPIGLTEWEMLLAKHEQRYPNSDRSVDSLRCKFASLYRKTVPAGNPNIPLSVKRAKVVRQKIIERSDLG